MPRLKKSLLVVLQRMAGRPEQMTRTEEPGSWLLAHVCHRGSVTFCGFAHWEIWEATLARGFGKEKMGYDLYSHIQLGSYNQEEKCDKHLTLYGDYSTFVHTLHIKKVKSKHMESHMTKAFIIGSVPSHQARTWSWTTFYHQQTFYVPTTMYPYPNKPYQFCTWFWGGIPFLLTGSNLFNHPCISAVLFISISLINSGRQRCSFLLYHSGVLFSCATEPSSIATDANEGSVSPEVLIFLVFCK